MLYFDYAWDLGPGHIIPDPDIDVGQLKWNIGDYWQVVEHNGRKILKKVDPLVQFTLDGSNGCS